MPTYSAITDAEIAVNKPVTNALMTKMRDNPLAIFEALGLQVDSKLFESTEQTMSAGGTLSIPHGLAHPPIWWQFFCVCKSAEYGFSVGDIAIPPMTANTTNGNGRGILATPDASNMNVKFTNDKVAMYRKDNGLQALLTWANWKLIIKAVG